MDSIARFRLVSRGGPGLACDDEGIALGPITLIDRSGSHYRLRSLPDLRRTLYIAYPKALAEWRERRIEGLRKIAEALESGNRVRARILAVQLGLPELGPAAVAKLRKFNPDWAVEPRVPAGQSGGQWTSGGGNGSASTGVIPAADNQPTPSGRSGGHRTTIISHGDGTIETRSGGTPAWRNNNPGNMKAGRFTDSHGAIGSDGTFAVFPDADTDYQAIQDRWSAPQHGQLTIAQAISTWAPKGKDANDPDSYANFVSRQTGLPLATKLGALTPEQVESVARAIRRKEGTVPGTVTITKP
ncbi:MAG: hypothetical protein ACREFL_18970 [Stellaceae bacterium]